MLKKASLPEKKIVVGESILRKAGVDAPFFSKAIKLSMDVHALNLSVQGAQARGVETSLSFGRKELDERMAKITTDLTELFKTHPDPKVKANSDSAAVLFMGMVQVGEKVPEALKKVKKEIYDLEEVQ